MKESSVQSRISSAYYKLTATERKAADYLMGHLSQAQFLSISELAEACGVAEATISRFCRRLGYGGYSAFKLAIAKSLAPAPHPLGEARGEVGPEDSVLVMGEKLLHTNTSVMSQTLGLLNPETLGRAADLLCGARQVYCMGQGGSMILAMEAAHLFSTCWPHYHAVQGSHIQAITAALLGEEDVLLFFSYSGSTRDILDLMQVARERRCKIILVTRFPKSPGAALADVVLQCGSDEGPLQMGTVPARISQLFLVDILFNEVCRRNLPEAMQNRERTASALAAKHI
ncbi:MAG: MurR/RpiR family transcriptional regulator [Angelakisella sp.]|nr:MurR/RpiR family transcriptional regulator [Angelakisella sp.]MCI9667866.1 MurR/RpiR family transcriptional regulator [Angelakisella sp.]